MRPTRIRGSMFKLLAVSILATTAAGLMWAQSYQGGLRGRVMDAQGAVIANAKVVITDDATAVKRDTVSTTEGEYVFWAVNPATHTLTAEKPGFKQFDRKDLIGA